MAASPCDYPRKARFQLWYAKVYFQEDPQQYKRRPVILLHFTPIGSWRAIYVTSKRPKSLQPDDVELQFWSQCGLTMPSYARCVRQVGVRETDFADYIGYLHPYDLANIKKTLRGVL
jgi:hypothetical protein